MHVIWAKGQEQKNYQHSPKSGLEKDVSLVKDFYKPDELKYHGHGSQRGVTSLNFFSKRYSIAFEKISTQNVVGKNDDVYCRYYSSSRERSSWK